MSPLFSLLLLAAPAPDFALRDGDTVVFLGDSITAARAYGKIVENYTLLRFPDRKVRFYNAGWGGDTAAGGLKRLESDVFVHKPTVVTVCYGINDIGWGLKADDKHKKIYLDSLAGIIAACQKRKIRVFILASPVTAADPAKSEQHFLQKMCDEALKLAKDKGAVGIDVQRSMRAIQKKVWAYNEKLKPKKKTTLHAADGVHLNDLGQVAMAYAILKGLNAPADVSSVRLDAKTAKVIEAKGCKVTNAATKDGELTFTRLDQGLPFNQGLFFALHYLFVPIPDELSRYMLRIDNLPAGRYEIKADDRSLGTFTAAQLGKGVNITFATASAWQPGGPWNAQANVLATLTDARHNLASGVLLSQAWMKGKKISDELKVGGDKADAELVALQRKAAKPRPYKFVIRKAEEKKDAKK